MLSSSPSGNKGFDIEAYSYGQPIIVTADEPVTLDKVDMLNREISLFTGEGIPLGSISLNKRGNKATFNNEYLDPAHQKDDLTYTFVLPNGYEVLIPVPEASDPPFFFTIGSETFPGFFVDHNGNSVEVSPKHCRIRIENDGSIKFRDLGSGKGMYMEILQSLEPEEDSEIVTRVDGQTIINKEWQSIFIREDQVYIIHAGQLVNPLGTLYKIPNAADIYLFRDKDTGDTYTLDPSQHAQNMVTFIDRDCKRLQFRVDRGELQVRAERRLFGDKYAGHKFGAIEKGGRGEIKGVINGGRPMAGFSERNLGSTPYNKYKSVNEDNLAVNFMNGRIVIADGLGSGTDSQHASALATRWIARSHKPLETAILDAHYAVRVMNRFVSECKDKLPSDAVFVAAELQGDLVSLAHTGDCRWLLIRDGKIFKRSNPHTMLQNMITDGDLTAREAATDLKYAKLRAVVTTTLLGARIRSELLGGMEVDQVEYDNLDLKHGDQLLMMSDGADCLTDDDILFALTGNNPDLAVELLRHYVKSRNENATYLKDFGDGKPPVAISSTFDNTTVVLYEHL